jgi:hypothetical protein
MKHRVQHPLPSADAKKLLDRALDTYREHYAEYSLKTGWVDDETAQVGFEVTGKKIDGQIRVCEDGYEIDLDLPWVFLPFKNKIAKSLDREFARWIEKA